MRKPAEKPEAKVWPHAFGADVVRVLKAEKGARTWAAEVAPGQIAAQAARRAEGMGGADSSGD